MTGPVGVVAVASPRQRVGRASYPLAAILSYLVGLSVALLVLAAPSALSLSGELWMSVAGAVLVGIGATGLCVSRLHDIQPVRWARIGPLFAVYTTVVFGVFSLGWLVPQQGTPGIIDPREIPGSVALFSVGLSTWTLGYLFGAPRAFMHGARQLVRRIFPGDSWALRFPSAPVVLFGIGFVASLYQLHAGSYGYLQNVQQALTAPSSIGHVIAILSQFSELGLVVAAIDAFSLSQSLRTKVVLGAMLMVQMASALYAGSKQNVVVAVASVGLVYMFATRRVPRRAAAGLVVLVLVVFPLVTVYRGVVRGPGSGAVSPGQAASAFVSTVDHPSTYLSPEVLFVESPAAVARRLREIDNVAIIRQKTPATIPYRPWTSLITDPLVYWIPRVVWPSKPVVATGLDFSRQYYDLPPTILTASAVTLPGDFYRHGGWLPLVGGMFVMGVLAFVADSALDPGVDMRRLLIFIPLLVMLVKMEGTSTAIVVSTLELIVAVVVAQWIAFVRS